MNKNSVWAITIICGLYLMCQLIADIGATKIVQVFGIVIPGGTFIFALTFTLRDLIHKRLGVEWARAAIVCAAGFNILMSLYLAGIGLLSYPAFFALGEAWNGIFSIVPAIVFGSIVAELVSELLDTEVYHLLRRKFPTFPQWSRVLISNAVSLPVDSLVFGSLAFVVLPSMFGAAPMGFVAAMGIVSGQIIWKGLVTVFSLPLIYLVKERDG